MSEAKIYRATAEREGAWWVIHVPEINSATQVRRLDQAEAMVRDLVHAITDEPMDSFEVDVHPELREDLGELVLRASASSSRAKVQQLEASLRIREAARALDAEGISIRDTGRLLGISYQRVQQLLNDQTDAAVLRERLHREMAKLDDPRAQVFAVPKASTS